jgi:hypothetical protein
MCKTILLRGCRQVAEATGKCGKLFPPLRHAHYTHIYTSLPFPVLHNLLLLLLLLYVLVILSDPVWPQRESLFGTLLCCAKSLSPARFLHLWWCHCVGHVASTLRIITSIPANCAHLTIQRGCQGDWPNIWDMVESWHRFARTTQLLNKDY